MKKKIVTRSISRLNSQREVKRIPLMAKVKNFSPKKQKKTKWQLGIIVKQKQKSPKKRRKSPLKRYLVEEGVMTRSVVRQLISKNMLDLDCGDVLVLKREPQKSVILNDDVLKVILSYLPLKERFRSQRVSKQFYSVVREMLHNQRALRIGNVADYYFECSSTAHSTVLCDVEDAIHKKFFYKYFYLNDISQSLPQLSSLFFKCPEVQSLELHNFCADSDTFKFIKWHLPRLQCLRLDEIKYDMTARKWSQIGQCLGDTLRHLCVDGRQVKTDLTNLVQHLPLLEEMQLRNYLGELGLLFKRLSLNLKSLSLVECPRLSPSSIECLVNNRQIARNLRSLTIQIPSSQSEEDTERVFSLICQSLPNLRQLAFHSHLCPNIIDKLVQLSQLESLELHFSRDQFLDLSKLKEEQLSRLKQLTIHGAFFRPKMLNNIGHCFPSLERLSLTNWAFVCECPDNPMDVLDDCPDCDDKCCQYLLSVTTLRQLFLEFLYSSDYIKPLILSLLTYEQLSKVTLVWYPINTSINSMNLVNAIVTSGARLATERPKEWIRFRFESSVIALIDQSKKWPKNLLLQAID